MRLKRPAYVSDSLCPHIGRICRICGFVPAEINGFAAHLYSRHPFISARLIRNPENPAPISRCRATAILGIQGRSDIAKIRDSVVILYAVYVINQARPLTIDVKPRQPMRMKPSTINANLYVAPSVRTPCYRPRRRLTPAPNPPSKYPRLRVITKQLAQTSNAQIGRHHYYRAIDTAPRLMCCSRADTKGMPRRHN